MNDSNTKIGWLFSWRTIRCCLFVLVCLFTLFALYYAEENWRGQRDWNTYRWELERRGEQLDYRAFIPQPVPDEENFAATPLVRPLTATILYVGTTSVVPLPSCPKRFRPQQ